MFIIDYISEAHSLSWTLQVHLQVCIIFRRLATYNVINEAIYCTVGGIKRPFVEKEWIIPIAYKFSIDQKKNRCVFVS